MIIEITLQEVMILLVSAFGIAAGILLLPILWDIKKMMGILRPMVETNQKSIEKAIKTIPGIFENAGHISDNIKQTTDKFKVSAPIILKEFETASNSAKESIELAGVIIGNFSSGSNIETKIARNTDRNGFMAYLNIFEEVIQIVYRRLSSNK